MRGKLNELWALIGAVKAVRERDAKGVPDGNVEWAVVDEDGLAQIAQARLLCCTCRFSGDLTTFLKDFGRTTGWPSSPDENSSERSQRFGGDQGDCRTSGHGNELNAAHTLSPPRVV